MSFDNKKLITKLIEIKEEYFQMVEKKYEKIEYLQEEIRTLEKRMKEIDKLIGINNIMDAETFLSQMKEESIQNVESTRIIHSLTDPNRPLVKMKYDGKKLEVFFPYPEDLHLKKESTIFVENVIVPLMPLNDTEPDMEVVVDKQNDLGMITKIIINNLYKIENLDEVHKVFRNLLDQI